MLKKLGWALVALAILAGLTRASADSGGGISLATLSQNIVTAVGNAATSIVSAITGSSVATVGPGVASTQGLAVTPMDGVAHPVAPKSAAPDILGTATLTAAAPSAQIPVGTLAGFGLQVTYGSGATGTLTAACSMDGAVSAPSPIKFRVKGAGGDTVAPATSITGSGNYKLIPADCSHIIITATSLTGGSVGLSYVQTAAADIMRVFNTLAEPLYTQPLANNAVVADANPGPVKGTGTRAAPNAGAVSTVPLGLPWTSSTAIEACHSYKVGPGSVARIKVVIGATSGFLKLYDTASATAPADGTDAPKVIDPVGSNGTWGWYDDDFGGTPTTFTNGLMLCFSSATNPFTLTKSATAFFSAQLP